LGLAMDVELLADEARIGLHAEDDVEVAGRSAPLARMTAPLDAQGLAVVHAGGDVDRQRGFLLDDAGTTTRTTRLADDLAVATAHRAHGLEREVALPMDDLPAAAALGASLRTGACFCPRAAAVFASLAPWDRDVVLAAFEHVAEPERELHLHVRAASRSVAPSRAEAETTEQVAEQIAEVAEDLFGAREPREARARRPFVAVLVIELTLFLVVQDLESFRRFFESLLGLLVPRIAIRVMLHGELSVSAFDLADRRVPRDAQNFVIVALRGHRARNLSTTPPTVNGLRSMTRVERDPSRLTHDARRLMLRSLPANPPISSLPMSPSSPKRPFPEFSGSSPFSNPRAVARMAGLGLLMGALLGPAGCKDETPTLFNESGVWQMLNFDIGRGLMKVDEDFRRQAMLLKFKSDMGIVQSAFCAETESQTAADSTCRIAVELTAWHCHCYAYVFEHDQMAWREFEAGEPRPSVSLADAEDEDDVWL